MDIRLWPSYYFLRLLLLSCVAAVNIIHQLSVSVCLCLSVSLRAYVQTSQIFDAYGIWPWLDSPLAVRYAGLLPVLWMTSLPIIGQAKATQRTLQYRCETWHDDALVLFSAVNTQDRRTIRYDTRCYFNVRSKADISQLNLPHGTDN